MSSHELHPVWTDLDGRPAATVWPVEEDANQDSMNELGRPIFRLALRYFVVLDKLLQFRSHTTQSIHCRT